MATLPSISAKGAYLLDVSANRTRYSKAGTTKRPLASTTKIMTAIVVLEQSNLNLDRLVTIKQTYRDYVVREGASTADLKAGDKLTVRQLLDALMLPSGCDAAYALADTFGRGTSIKARTTSFISQMNSKAVALGMTRTKFDSFDGISPNGYTYSTPQDMARLARRAITNKTLRAVTTKKKSVQRATNGRTYTWYNTNKLLGSYTGAIGIKTGTGTAAGPCLVFAASRNGHVVAGVVLNDTNRYTDAAKLLDYAYGSSTASTMTLRQLPAGAQQD
nr:serine hydrolase [Wenjunlia vitaminophila]